MPVVASIALGGVVAGVAAVALGFLAYDVFFIPPYGTLAVGRALNWLPLGIYLVVGAIAISLDDARRRSDRRARERGRALAALADLPERLLEARDASGMVEAAVAALARVVEGGGAALIGLDGDQTVRAAMGSTEVLDEVRRLCAIEGDRGVGAYGGSGELEVRRAIVATLEGPEGALVVWGRRLTPAVAGALDVAAHQLSAGLERERLHEARLRLASLEQADRWRVSLLRTVSHDLLTPLAAIEAGLSSLEAFDGALSQRERDDLLRTALAQCRRASTLVVDLLDVNRIEAGVRTLKADTVDLVALARDVVANVDLPDLGSTLEVEAEGPVVVRGDAALLREVIWNLVDNALRHGPLGDVVTVHVEEGERGATVWVRDHGVAVALAGRRDERVDWFHASGVSGRTGLGLAIARGFVEAHGGELAFDVDAHHTVVRFTVPRCLPTGS